MRHRIGFRGSPIFGSRLPTVKQAIAFAFGIFAVPFSCLPAAPSTSRASIGTLVQSVPAGTRCASSSSVKLCKGATPSDSGTPNYVPWPP